MRCTNYIITINLSRPNVVHVFSSYCISKSINYFGDSAYIVKETVIIEYSIFFKDTVNDTFVPGKKRSW